MKRSELSRKRKEMERRIRAHRFFPLSFCGFAPVKWQVKCHDRGEVRGT